MLILEENLRCPSESLASELFIYIYIERERFTFTFSQMLLSYRIVSYRMSLLSLYKYTMKLKKQTFKVQEQYKEK